MVLAGRGKASGWWVAIAAQGLWVPYDIVTSQYGFLLITVVSVPLYVRELSRLRRR